MIPAGHFAQPLHSPFVLAWDHAFVTVTTIVIIMLVLVLLGVLPTWRHSANWGYTPSGALGTVLIVMIIMIVVGRL